MSFSALRNQIVNTDCIEGMRLLPDGCIPLTVTSPPYDGIRQYGGHAFDFEGIARELVRVTMPAGVIVWIVQDQIVDGVESGSSMRQMLYFNDLGMATYQTLIMQVNAWRFPHKRRYPKQFHYAFVLSKGRPRVANVLRDRRNKCVGQTVRQSQRNKDGSVTTLTRRGKTIGRFGSRGSVWTYEVGGRKNTKDLLAYQHPAIMPEAMAEDHILSWSRPGDLIFDPMCGAGTTCKMAMLNHRSYLGMEIHQPYWEIACERLELAKEEHRQRLYATLMAGKFRNH